MITLQHPYAPTVTYSGTICEALTAYVTEHLYGFDTFVVEVPEPHQVTVEVFEAGTDTSLGSVSVH